MDNDTNNIHMRKTVERRIDKLDSFFLWVSSFSALGFSVVVAYLKTPLAPYVPIFILIGYSIMVGYISGAIFSDSFTERIRGWNYLLLGLAFYAPSAVLKFGEPYIQTQFPAFSRLSPYFQLIVGLGIPIIFFLVNRWFAIPRIFQSFKIFRGDITNLILRRTIMSSVYLGCILYVFALALYEMKTDLLSLLLYGLFFILFVIPLVAEEIANRNLLRLEKYQRFLRLESIVNRRLRIASFALIVTGTIAFVVFRELGAYLHLYLSIFLFVLAFSLPIFGLIILMFFVHERHEITLSDKAKKELTDQLKELKELISKMRDVVINENKRKKGGKFTGSLLTNARPWTAKYFFYLFFAIGLLITVFLGVLPYYSYYNAPSYSFQPSFSGFGVARNYTDNILPDRLIIIVGVEPRELFFQYHFSCSENGTYNFLFVFPFYVTGTISCTDNMNFTATSKGSAIWLSYPVENVHYGGIHHYIWGDFLIENTFQSGTRGSYVFILPFGMGISQEVIGNHQRELGVAFHTPDSEVELGFAVPARFQITQTFPELSEGPTTWITPTNRSITSIGWRFENLRDSVTIYCEDPNEVSFYQTTLLLGGLFLGFGMSLVARTIYDRVKEWARGEQKNINRKA